MVRMCVTRLPPAMGAIKVVPKNETNIAKKGEKLAEKLAKKLQNCIGFGVAL